MSRWTYSLTDREVEILNMGLDGSSNREIGKAMGISFQTVKNHFKNIYRKMGVHGRTQMATRWALSHSDDSVSFNAAQREEIIRLGEELASLRAQLFAVGIERDNWKSRAARATKFAISSK